MPTTKQQEQNIKYYPQSLMDKLQAMNGYPLTLLEAPSGFGKTTAVQEYISRQDTGGSYWYTCFGEPLQKAWNGICAALSHLDSDTARLLCHIGLPTEDNLADIADAMRRLCCEVDTWLVIDNYQYIQNRMPPQLIEALAVHQSPRLHILLITQETGYLHSREMQSDRVYCVETSAFFFSRQDVDNHFRNSGVSLSPKALDDLHQSTEGWISAINLQKLHYLQTGTLEQTTAIDSLISSAIWNRLEERERRFLTSVSLFDSFTPEQARIMLGEPETPPWTLRLLASNVFIRYDKARGVYLLHNLLRSFLEQQREQLADGEKNKLQRLAGDAYAARGMNYPALCCYLEQKQYDKLLALPLRGNELTDYLNEGCGAVLEQIVRECPPETLMRYPEILLVIAFELFMIGNFPTFGYLCEVIGTLLNQAEQLGMSTEQQRQISGQFLHLQSFGEFNDIEKMSEKHRAAWDLLQGPASLLDWHGAWTFGQPSVLFLFWSKTGELKRELDQMDECLPYYNRLTCGHGTGAQCVMRAEALLLQGDDTSAEALCHKALYLASAKQQDSICCTAELTLLRIALLRGDTAAYAATIENLSARVASDNEAGTKKMVELSLAFLNITQGVDELAPWLYDPEKIQNTLYPVAVPYGMLLYLQSLLLQGEDAKLLGLIGGFFPVVEQLNFLLPQLYLLLFSAVAQLRQGRENDALVSVSRALDMALPDQIYLPFAEYGAYLLPLLEQRSQREGVEHILALCSRQAAGVAKLQSARSKVQNQLPPREQEVAKLAAQGLTNAQIATKLFISLDTVKTSMKRIFQRLNIQSRVQLKDFRF